MRSPPRRPARLTGSLSTWTAVPPRRQHEPPPPGRVRCRVVGPEVRAAALGARERRARHQARHGQQRSGLEPRPPASARSSASIRAQRLPQPVRRAHEAGALPHQGPQLASGPRPSRRPPRARAAGLTAADARRRPGSASATERATRAPKTRASSSELLASRFAPWTPVHAASPRGPQPGHARAAVEAGRDAAHVIVRGRRHGDRLRGAGRCRARGRPRTPSG